MDLTNIIGEVEGVAAKFGLTDELNKAVTALGVSPATVTEIEGKAKELLAGGMNKDAIVAQLTTLAQSKGVPQPAIDMIMKMIPETPNK